MKEPEMIEIRDRAFDPLDLCQYEIPMSFCKQCGTWMHCKREGVDIDYRRRKEENND